MRERSTGEILIVFVLVLLGAMLRLDFLIANHFVIDADEAIVGLMGKHILEGKSLPIFYYGQHYMGSFEALTAALFFKLFGLSSMVLKCVPLLFSLLLIVVVYLLGRELGGRSLAAVSGLLIAVPASPLMVWSAMARGGFIEIVVIGALALLCLVRWLKQGAHSLTLVWLIGLLLGLGWWVNNQILYTMVPTALGLVSGCLWSKDSKRLKKLFVVGGVCLAGFAIGSAPFWYYNLTHDFASFGLFKRATLMQALSHLAGVWWTALPILLGGKRFWSDSETFSGALAVVYAMYALLLGAYLWERRRQLGQLFVLRLEHEKPIELFLVMSGAAIAIFALSSFGYLVEAPRYLLPLYPAIALIAGYAIIALGRCHAACQYAALTALLVINLCSSYNLCSSSPGERAIPGEPHIFSGQRVSKDQSELMRWLIDNSYSMIATNYWIGYRLAFESSERIRFKIIHEPEQVRIPEYEAAAAQLPADKIPQVLTPAQATLVRRALIHMCYTFKEIALSGYVVLYDIKRDLSQLQYTPTSAFEVTASDKPEAAFKAVDGDRQSRWGSGRAQAPGMEFSARFHQPQSVGWISLDAGQWWASDFPRALTVDLEDSQGARQTVLSSDDTYAIRFFQEHDPRFLACFPAQVSSAIILRQQGKDELFDWSIAELGLGH